MSEHGARTLETATLIKSLKTGVPWRWVGDGSDNREIDLEAAAGLMMQAAIILQAVFDPENQPSQFGTALSALTATGDRTTVPHDQREPEPFNRG